MENSTDFQLNYYVKTIKIPYLGQLHMDDLVYLLCMILAIPIGLIFRTNMQPKTKAKLSAAIGFAMTILVAQKDAYHSMIVMFVNTLFLTMLSPRYVHYFSFIWCMGYLIFFRMTTYFGLDKPVQFANAVQLILTLKAIGVSFEIHDTWLRKKNHPKLSETVRNQLLATANDQTKDQKQIEETQKNADKLAKLELEMEFCSLVPKPSFLDLYLYYYCHIGILTGPYFKYRTFYDWQMSNYSSCVNPLKFILSRGKTLPFIIVLFAVVSKFVSFKDARTDEFYENPLWYRLFYMTLIFTIFKLRFYVAWILAEFSCMTAGFGLYPSLSKPRPGGGPTNLTELKKFQTEQKTKSDLNDVEFDYQTIHNIDEYGVETAPTVKSVLHTWNETVQYWMAQNVYKRVFFRPIGQGWTMFVSAYWHGLHPGYYMSMLTCTPGIWAETYMDKGFKQRFMSPKHYYIFDIFTWFCRSRLFDYMSMGFILLDYESTIRFWSSVYFIGHVYCVFFTVLGLLLCQLPKAKAKKEQ